MLRDSSIAEIVARALNISIYHFIYPPDSPVAEEPIIIKSIGTGGKKLPFLVLVQLPDQSVGSMSVNSEIGPVPYENLPPTMKARIVKAKSIRI